MSIAGEMKTLADSRQPELTFGEKHKLLRHIRGEADKGLYKTTVECGNTYYSMSAYLVEQGFKVDPFVIVADNQDIVHLQVSWGHSI